MKTYTTSPQYILLRTDLRGVSAVPRAHKVALSVVPLNILVLAAGWGKCFQCRSKASQTEDGRDLNIASAGEVDVLIGNV